MAILVEISAGELLDKISILEIKSERMTDPEKLRHVREELAMLIAGRDRALSMSPALEDLYRELKGANEELWQIENDIRACERRQDFGAEFVAFARAVYRTNDRRCEIKRRINAVAGSPYVEQKDYAAHDGASRTGPVAAAHAAGRV